MAVGGVCVIACAAAVFAIAYRRTRRAVAVSVWPPLVASATIALFGPLVAPSPYIIISLWTLLVAQVFYGARRIRAPVVIVVDGEIGAGKTALIGVFAAHLRGRGLRVAVVPEPVDEWRRVGILQMFYGDPAKHAYAFQTYTYVTRIKKTIQVVADHPPSETDVYLLERSILTDRYVFMELQRDIIPPVFMVMYDGWWDMWARLMPIAPTHQVYLKPSISICQERVQRRHREGEICDGGGAAAATGKGGVSPEYQVRLRQAHEAFAEGRGRDAFPGMPPPAPGLVSKTMGGDLADRDFRPGAPGHGAACRFLDTIV